MTRIEDLEGDAVDAGELDDPIQPLVTSILKELGEDPGRNGLQKTPSRVRMLWLASVHAC